MASEFYTKFQGKGLKFEHCPLLNVSQCQPTESDSNFVVNVYNPLMRTVTNKMLRLPVTDKYVIKTEQQF